MRNWMAVGLAAIAAFGIAGCGDDDPSGPVVGGDVTLAPAPRSGVDQVAAPGEAFADDFQIQVLVGGIPAGGITVEWNPNDGIVNPATSVSGTNGIATTTWALVSGTTSRKGDGSLASAEVAKVVTLTATAPSLSDTVSLGLDAFSIPADHAVVEVRNNEFTPIRPAGATNIPPGTSVTWYWTSDARTHNVAPTGASGLPTRSGEARDGAFVYTQFFEVTSNNPYVCEVDHGGLTHSGAVTVDP